MPIVMGKKGNDYMATGENFSTALILVPARVDHVK
jgi:hypothetical protein